MNKNKNSNQKATPSQLVLLFFVAVFYNYSLVSIAAFVVFLLFFIKDGVAVFEGATVGNIFSLVFGVLLFFPVRNLRKKLRGE